MADMFDYLQWRGDILFSQMGPNDVDALVFSSLAYLDFSGIVPEDAKGFVLLRDAAQQFLELPDQENRCRVMNDVTLLKAAAETERFGRVGMSFYRSIFDPAEDTQFAAVTFYLEDGTAFLAYRGTDNTLVGWKEDFNMTFQESIPAQRLALEYARELTFLSCAPLYLGGHSKGGNLAVYAGAKCGPEIQDRILRVYNHDGPGFAEGMLQDPGYRRIVPKIRRLVPQYSIFGMLLEHGEDHTVIRSNQIGIMQHDPYSWQIMGGSFILMDDRTEDSHFLERTFKLWLAGMTNEERSEFFDVLFDLLMMENASRPSHVIRPQNLVALFKTLQMDEDRRRVLTSVLMELLEAAKQSQIPTEDPET